MTPPRRRSAGAATLLAILPALSTACVEVAYSRRSDDHPVQPQTDLVPGTSDLAACLSSLGAPHSVLALPHRGIGLVYRSLRSGTWDFMAEYYASGRFVDRATDAEVLLLTFDGALILRSMQHGTAAALDLGRIVDQQGFGLDR
ncbi:MAG: hypothetical protein R3F56_10160 [Planctomycetota bacterium]